MALGVTIANRGISQHAESNAGQDVGVFFQAVVAPVHRHAKEFVLCVSHLTEVAERAHEVPTRLQPITDSPEQGGVLLSRYVKNRVEGDDCIEARVGKVDRRNVAMHKGRARHVRLCEPDHLAGSINSRYSEPSGQPSCCGNSGAASDVEYRSTIVQEFAQQIQFRVCLSHTGIGVGSGTPVVAALNESLLVDERVVRWLQLLLLTYG